MEQSDAERQLVALLRGLDLPEFSLQISISEKHSDPLMVGGRGWHLLENPTWTVTMAVPQVAGQRTTMSGASFARAWQLQELWWRATRKAAAFGGVDYRQVMAPDSVERAESQLLGAVRGEAGGEFAISIAVKGGHWLVSCAFQAAAEGAASAMGPVSHTPGFTIGPGGGICPRSYVRSPERACRQSPHGETGCQRPCVSNHRGAPAPNL